MTNKLIPGKLYRIKPPSENFEIDSHYRFQYFLYEKIVGTGPLLLLEYLPKYSPKEYYWIPESPYAIVLTKDLKTEEICLTNIDLEPFE